MCLKMPSENSIGFSDHMRFHALVGESVDDFKELTHRRSSSCLLIEWRIFYTRITSKHQESKDDVPGQPEQKPKIRTSNYSHKAHKKQATNPSVLEVHILMYEA